MKGTPKTLKQAISNALSECDPDVTADEVYLQRIEEHVRDFLAQKFTPAMIRQMSIEELWESITGRRVGEYDRRSA